MKHGNAMVTPHMAGVTKEARIRMGRIAAEQMLDALDGKPVPRIINPQVFWDHPTVPEDVGFAPARRRTSRTGTRRRTNSTFPEAKEPIQKALDEAQ